MNPLRQNSHARRRPVAVLAVAGSLCLIALVVEVGAAAAKAKPHSTAKATLQTPAAVNPNPVTYATCPDPDQATVNVSAFDDGLVLDQSTVPCGMVTFNVTNQGTAPHSFDISYFGAPTLDGGGVGPLLDPGETATMTVDLTPGSWDYRSDGYDVHLGLTGSLTVTGYSGDATDD